MPKLNCAHRCTLCWALCLLAAAMCSGEEPALPTSKPKVVQVELKFVEVQTGKMNKLGFSWSQLTNDGAQEQSLNVLESIKKTKSLEQLDGFFESLRLNGLATTLAEPTLTTLDGRPASLVVGTTELDIVPIVLGSGQVRLECRLKVDSAPQGNFQIDTAVQLEPSQKCVIFHAPRKPPATVEKPLETDLLLLARVEVRDSALQR